VLFGITPQVFGGKSEIQGPPAQALQAGESPFRAKISARARAQQFCSRNRGFECNLCYRQPENFRGSQNSHLPLLGILVHVESDAHLVFRRFAVLTVGLEPPLLESRAQGRKNHG
jgi:hypothetical protein